MLIFVLVCLCSFAIILTKKRELDAFLVLSFECLVIPPANFVCGGYTVFTLSVRACVRLCMRPSVRP